jgi:replicative DNA helicase
MTPDPSEFHPDMKPRRRGAAADLSTLDRLPPHSIEAEQGVLGCILISPEAAREVIPQVLDRLHQGVSAFYDQRHQQILAACLELDTRGIALDLVTVRQALHDAGNLDATGGLAYLSELSGAVPSAAMARYYIDIVREKARLRAVLTALCEGVAKIHDSEAEPEATCREIEERVIAANTVREARAVVDAKVGARLVVEAMGRSEEHRNKGLQLGYQTGLSYFDKMCGGLQRRTVFYLGGQQSVGKTSLAVSIVRALAIDPAPDFRVPTGFLSLESASTEIFFRLVCNDARVNGHQIHSGFPSERDKQAVVMGLKSRWNTPPPIWVDDTKGLTPADLRTRARSLVRQHGIKVLVIDHLHRVVAPDSARWDERTTVNRAVQAVRWIADTLDVAVVCLAQLNREAKKNQAASKWRRPEATDLRESASVEEDADILGILARDQSDDEDGDRSAAAPESETWPVILQVAKNRNGPTGPCRLTFHRPSFRYEDGYLGRGSEEGAERKRKKQGEQGDFGDY